MSLYLWRLALPLFFLISAVPGVAKAYNDMSDQKRIVDFSETDREQWYVINDGVMGGVSMSEMRLTDKGTAVFSGTLSLENNGGFVSARTDVGNCDLSIFAGLEIRVRGDGRSYQLRLRTDDRFDGIAYRAVFETRDGEWITVRVPFDRFLPTYRGRTLRDAPPLNTSRIRQLGFLLADKTPGPFLLEIDFVRAWDSANIDP